MLIVFHFIGNKLTGNDLSNYIAFTLIGSFVYIYFAIKILDKTKSFELSN